MKKNYILSILFVFFTVFSVFSQDAWVKENNVLKFSNQELIHRKSKPTTYNLYSVNSKLISEKLQTVSRQQSIVKFPTPNGMQRFLVREASIFSKELAAKYPTIKSYVGVGIDDKTARIRFSKSNDGLHAMISSGNYPLFLIDPYTKDKNTVITYHKNKVQKSDFECLVEETISKNKQITYQKSNNANDGKLRTYRMAIVATGNYSQFHLTNQGVGAGESDATKKAAILSAINTSMTRINGIYERDLSITMQLVGNNDNLIFLDANTDGLTDDDISSLINESQTKCDAIIGDANYDIGHVFGKDPNANGLAGGGVVCITGQKALGASIGDSPITDSFDLDVVAHEIGHQFGANHTQNNDCNRNNPTAMEPGSGSTIMGYGGWCSPNVQNFSDAYFHAISIEEMWSFVSTEATCATETATNNNAPVANAGNDYTIPKSTPFILKGSATDADAENVLTYTWEQMDNETATMPPLSTNTVGPLFRSLTPSTSPNRYMPALATVLAGNTSTTWEVLPSVGRTLNFSLTVRDNVDNGASTSRDNMVITVNSSSGPFVMTSQSVSTTYTGNSTQTIEWNVANTSAAPVSCANVNILLSTDGGITYDTVLKSNTPNDGTEDVVLPNIDTTQARIMIEAVDNIFYAVNASTFSIDQVAGIEDELFVNFNVYPNPTNGKITLSFKTISLEKIVVELFDIRGRKISKQEFNSTTINFNKELDYQSVSKGLYILKVYNGQHQISKKIVID